MAKEWRQHRVVEWRMDNDVHGDQMATACFNINACLYVMDRRKRKTSSNLLHVIRTIETLLQKCKELQQPHAKTLIRHSLQQYHYCLPDQNISTHLNESDRWREQTISQLKKQGYKQLSLIFFHVVGFYLISSLELYPSNHMHIYK